MVHANLICFTRTAFAIWHGRQFAVEDVKKGGK